MANVVITPNMTLPNPVPSVDPGPDYANNLSSSLNIIDGHNHAPGSGVQIGTDGLSIGNDLPLNSNSLVSAKSVVFSQQASLATLNALFVGTDGNLYFNDGVSDPSIKMTSGGAVNATSSGISSGAASASFVGGVLVVNVASNTPANIQGGSVLLGNNVSSSKFLTLAPPAAMASSFGLTLPSLPGSTSFLSIDTGGNIAPAVGTSHGITGSNIQTNVNLPGSAVQENGLNLVVSNTNATNSLSIVRGAIDGATGNIQSGEGFTPTRLGNGLYQIAYTTDFGDVPAINITPAGRVFVDVLTWGAGFFEVLFTTPTNTAIDTSFFFTSIGQRP